MARDLAIYNYDGNLVHTIPSFITFSIDESSSTVRRLASIFSETRGSGYTDDEIAQSNADLQTSFTGVTSDENVEYKLNWGKGLAQITIDEEGVYPSTLTALSLTVNPVGYVNIVDFSATVTIDTISGGTTQEIDTITVTNPGVYLPILSVPEDERSFELVLTPTPAGTEPDTSPELTQVISNYLSHVNIISKGGGVTENSPLLTLDDPGAQAGDATISAATVRFNTETFNSTVINFTSSGLTDVSIKIDVDNFDKIFKIIGENDGLPQNPFTGVKRGKNVFFPGDSWACIGKLQRSPVLIREEY